MQKEVAPLCVTLAPLLQQVYSNRIWLRSGKCIVAPLTAYCPALQPLQLPGWAFLLEPLHKTHPLTPPRPQAHCPSVPCPLHSHLTTLCPTWLTSLLHLSTPTSSCPTMPCCPFTSHLPLPVTAPRMALPLDPRPRSASDLLGQSVRPLYTHTRAHTYTHTQTSIFVTQIMHFLALTFIVII